MMPGTADSGVLNWFGVDQAVVGDTITITPTMIADVRASFVRFFYPYYPDFVLQLQFRLKDRPRLGEYSRRRDLSPVADAEYYRHGQLSNIRHGHRYRQGVHAFRSLYQDCWTAHHHVWRRAAQANGTTCSPTAPGPRSTLPALRATPSSSMADSNTGYGFASLLTGLSNLCCRRRNRRLPRLWIGTPAST